MSKSRVKTILLSSHPDDINRLDDLETLSKQILEEKLSLVGRHKLTNRGSGRPSFLKAQLLEWCSDADLGVVLITRKTSNCAEVADDITTFSTCPLGVVGLRLEGSLSPSPSGCCVEQALWDGGFEVIDHEPDETRKALKRAEELTKLATKINNVHP